MDKVCGLIASSFIVCGVCQYYLHCLCKRSGRIRSRIPSVVITGLFIRVSLDSNGQNPWLVGILVDSGYVLALLNIFINPPDEVHDGSDYYDTGT